MEDNEDEGVSIDKGYEDKEDNEDDVLITEYALKQGESLEVVPSRTQFILGEVFEEDYACRDMNNQLEVVVGLASIKVEECVYDSGEFSQVWKD